MSLSVKIEIDENSGFCFGVVNAIRKSEETLRNDHKLYCLGDIVHNTQEVERLKKLGLETINHQQIEQLRDTKVLLRAHGEPPSTYQVAQENNIEIIDASCPVVLQLQKKIKRAFEENPTQQIVIYGKNGHAEVNGLVGQTCGKAIVVESENDIEKIDFGKEIVLFSQTTKYFCIFDVFLTKPQQIILQSPICNSFFLTRNYKKHLRICKKSSNFARKFKICTKDGD
mgnify:CR=1 FL=1